MTTNQSSEILPSFQSEALLQQAIAGLLARMPGIKGVQILQGPQEIGKDIVFVSKGPLSEDLPCACVVKNSRITGQAGKTGSARTVLQQIQESLDTPYTDGSGQDISVQRVYVVCPFNLGASTMASIEGGLKKDSGRVVFFSGHDLFQLFREHWPDYFADEAAALEQYMASAAIEIANDQPVAFLSDIYDLGKTSAHLQNVYVTPTFHRRLTSYDGVDISGELIPDSEELKAKWTVSRYRRRIGDLRSVIRIFDHLESWGYVGPGLQEMLKDIVLKLEVAFVGGAEEKYHRTKISLNQLEPAAEFDLAETKELEKLSKSARDLLYEKLNLFQKDLDSQREFLDSLDPPPINSMHLLEDPQFIRAMALDDCLFAGLGNAADSFTSLDFVFPETLIDDWNSPILVVGSPGSGKTSFCRWNALLDTERFKAEEELIIPIYIALNRLSGSTINNFEDVLIHAAKSSALLGEVSGLILDNESYKIRVYLDGLDEVPDTEKRERIMELAREFSAGNDRFQMIFTARDTIYDLSLGWLPRISLDGMDDKQLRRLAENWLDKDESVVESFFTQLSTIPSLVDLVRNPLMATLTILVFRRTQQLPDSKSRLYSMFVDLLSGGWDLAKGIRRESEFSREVKLMVLSGLAADTHNRRNREFSRRDLRRSARNALGNPQNIDLETLENELVNDGLITNSGKSFEFSHLSFQEFLAAKSFLGSPNPSQIGSALRKVFQGDTWWFEFVAFFISLSGNPKDLLSWITDEGNRYNLPMNNENRLMLISMVQKSYPDYSLS